MQTSARSLIYLTSTFLIGILVGAAGYAFLRGAPPGGPPEGARRGVPGGFVSHMESTIQPRDEEQRRAIMRVLESTDLQNRAVVDSSQQAMYGHLLAMQSELDSLLEPAQRERLASLIRELRERPSGPPGGGRPPPPGGRRPPG